MIESLSRMFKATIFKKLNLRFFLEIWLFFSGSSDRFMYIWDVSSKNIAYKLPGHQGSVNAVDFHPKESIGFQKSNINTLILFEIFSFVSGKWQADIFGRVGSLNNVQIDEIKKGIWMILTSQFSFSDKILVSVDFLIFNAVFWPFI